MSKYKVGDRVEAAWSHKTFVGPINCGKVIEVDPHSVNRFDVRVAFDWFDLPECHRTLMFHDHELMPERRITRVRNWIRKVIGI